MLPAYSLEKLAATHTRHSQVQQDEVISVLLDRSKSKLRAFNRLHRVAQRRQGFVQELSDYAVVIYDQ